MGRDIESHYLMSPTTAQGDLVDPKSSLTGLTQVSLLGKVFKFLANSSDDRFSRSSTEDRQVS